MSKFKWKFDKHQSLKLKLAEILVVGVKNQKDVENVLDYGPLINDVTLVGEGVCDFMMVSMNNDLGRS